MAILIIIAVGCALFAIAYKIAGVSEREDREVAAAVERLAKSRAETKEGDAA